MDIYRRVAFTYPQVCAHVDASFGYFSFSSSQLPKKPDQSIISTLPSIMHQAHECLDYQDLFQQSYEQYQRFNQYLQEKCEYL